MSLLEQQRATFVPAGTWTADPAHSSIEFKVKHMMIATVTGRFSDFEATVTPESVEATVRSASVDTNAPQRDEHLRSPDFFDAASFPEIRVASTDIRPTGDDTFRVAGEITMRGVTKPIELEATVTGNGVDPWGNDRVALEVRGELNRKDFGLNWNQALEAGGVLVSDKVELVVDASLVRAAS